MMTRNALAHREYVALLQFDGGICSPDRATSPVRVIRLRRGRVPASRNGHRRRLSSGGDPFLLSVMLLSKTEKAHEAIRVRDTALGRIERQIAILANGQRTEGEILDLLGARARSSIDWLVAEGFLVRTPRAVERLQGRSARDGETGRETEAASIQARFRERVVSATRRFTAPHAGHSADSPVTAQQRPATSGQQAVRPAPRAGAGLGDVPVRRLARRSLAASKMYMLDMLQLLRSPEASALAVVIHTCQDDEALAGSLVEALHFVDRSAGRGFASKVLAQLRNTFPESLLPLLETGAIDVGGADDAVAGGTGAG